MIAHPPCTFLTVSGNKWMNHPRFPNRKRDRERAIKFVLGLAHSDISRIAIENPVGVLSTRWRKPDQYIQPYEFGHPETKKTGLWLKGLPKLLPTNVVEPQFVIGKQDGKKYSPTHYMTAQNGNRSKLRSITYQGIADAMAAQWGILHETTKKREAIIWPKNCVTCGWFDHGGICRNPHLGVKNYCIIDNDWKPKKARNQQNRGEE